MPSLNPIRMIIVAATLSLAFMGCSDKKDKDGGGGGGVSAADICKKHAKTEDDIENCVEQTLELKEKLGKYWKEFANCAMDAEDERAAGSCITKEMSEEMRKERKKDKDRGASASTGGGTSPADVCKKHGGDDEAKCLTETKEMKAMLGKHWDEFATCAIDASDKKAAGKCLTEDMMESIKKSMGN